MCPDVKIHYCLKPEALNLTGLKSANETWRRQRESMESWLIWNRGVFPFIPSVNEAHKPRTFTTKASLPLLPLPRPFKTSMIMLHELSFFSAFLISLLEFKDGKSK